MSEIDKYLNIQHAYAPSFAPAGDAVAFISNATGLPQVYYAKPDPDNVLWPDQLTFGEDRVASVRFSSTQPLLIYARDKGGNEDLQLYLLDPVNREETALTEGFEDAFHLFVGWHPDGESYFFAANRRDKALVDLYKGRIGDTEAQLIIENNEAGYLWSVKVAPDGERVIVVRLANSSETTLFSVPINGGEVVNITPEPALYFLVGFDAQGQLIIRTDRDADFIYLASLDLETSELTPLLQPNWDIEMAALAPDKKTLIYSVNEEGTSRLHLYNLEDSSSRPCPLTQKGLGVLQPGATPFSADSQNFTFGFFGATQTSDCYVWRLQEDTVYPVTRSAHGGLATKSFVTPELVHYPSFDDLSIPAWLFVPDHGEGPYPVVMYIHGGPEGQTRPFLSAILQYFVAQGYAVLAPNVRGSVGYGKHYAHLDDVRKRMDSVADLASAVEWLKTQGNLDASRVAVYGGSYGGFMVLAALTSYPELFKAGVNIVGISNFVTFLENTSSYRRAHREAEYGSLTDDRDFLEEISPLNHIDKVRVPVIVIHGKNDPRVPVSEAEQLVERLNARGIDAPLMIFDDEGHGLVKLKNKRVAYPRVAEFLDEHL
mgnify:CR=1 FL=1